jgi:23S rRNA A2030 N6-methylase RlmJ
MSFKRRLAKALLLLTLIWLPVKSHQEIEDIVYRMNRTRVEIRIAEKKAEREPKQRG